mgnify:CR=1 FL=1
MQINSKTVALMQGISNQISSSGLPPCVVGLVLDKLRSQVDALEAKAIRAERQAAAAQDRAASDAVPPPTAPGSEA